MSKYAKKTDKNQTEIVNYLRSVGVKVWVTSNVGNSLSDLQIIVKGRLYMLEIKNPETAYGKKGLNASQEKYSDWCGKNYLVWHSISDAETFLTEKGVII